MPKTLSPNTLSAIRSYIDDGISLEDLDISQTNRDRVKIAESVYERLCQDPMLDVMQCLRRVYGRSLDQARLDMEVVEMFISSMDDVPRKLLTYRARKTAEKLVRIGEQTGDAKWIDKGLSQLIRLDRLDEEEVIQEDVRNTAQLPPVLVSVNVVNTERDPVDDMAFKALIDKYGGKVDDFDRMVAMRRRRLAGEDINTMEFDDYDEQ